MDEIYAIKCAHGKYYVGKSKKCEARLQQHTNKTGAQWTRLHPVIHGMFMGYGNSDTETAMTLQFMHKYGIENVRGAAWVRAVLSPSEKDHIRQQMAHHMNLCFNCMGPGHMQQSCKNKVDSQWGARNPVTAVESLRSYPVSGVGAGAGDAQQPPSTPPQPRYAAHPPPPPHLAPPHAYRTMSPGGVVRVPASSGPPPAGWPWPHLAPPPQGAWARGPPPPPPPVYPNPHAINGSAHLNTNYIGGRISSGITGVDPSTQQRGLLAAAARCRAQNVGSVETQNVAVSDGGDGAERRTRKRGREDDDDGNGHSCGGTVAKRARVNAANNCRNNNNGNGNNNNNNNNKKGKRKATPRKKNNNNNNNNGGRGQNTPKKNSNRNRRKSKKGNKTPNKTPKKTFVYSPIKGVEALSALTSNNNNNNDNGNGKGAAYSPIRAPGQTPHKGVLTPGHIKAIVDSYNSKNASSTRTSTNKGKTTVYSPIKAPTQTPQKTCAYSPIKTPQAGYSSSTPSKSTPQHSGGGKENTPKSSTALRRYVLTPEGRPRRV